MHMKIEEITWPDDLEWHLGVTGGRRRVSDDITYPTLAAMDMIEPLLSAAWAHGARHLHHGACTGWDEATVNIASVTVHGYTIYAHPPIKDVHLSQRAIDHSHVIFQPKEYRDRNFDIAAMSDVLLVGASYPEFDERSRHSGTWQTARYGRRLGDALYSVDMNGELSDVTRHVHTGTNPTEAGV